MHELAGKRVFESGLILIELEVAWWHQRDIAGCRQGPQKMGKDPQVEDLK